MKRILILENDWLVLSSLNDSLKNKGYLVNCAQSIRRAEELLLRKRFDLFLCERVLEDGDALSLLERINEKNLFMRVLVLSHKKSLPDRIETLQLANDFLAKPFNSAELNLRIENLLNLEKIGRDKFVENSLFLFKDSGASVNPKHLRPQELKILECLLKHKSMVISYETIASYVWGYRDSFARQKTISVYIRRIRMKLLEENLQIITFKNRGYKLIDLKERNI